MKNRICIILFGLLIAGTSTLNAQSGLENIKSKIDPSKMIGVFTYEANDIFQNIKVKNVKRKRSVTNILEDYNKDVLALKSENMNLLVDLGGDIKEIVKSKNFIELLTLRTSLNKELAKMKEEVDLYQEKLDEEMSLNLKKRKYKKWIKYQEGKKKAMEEAFNLTDIFTKTGLFGS